MINNTKTRLTVFKDSRNNIVHKFEIYKTIKATKSRRIFTEIYNIESERK